MRTKRKIKRKITLLLTILVIVAIGVGIASTKLITVEVNSQSLDTETNPANFIDTTSIAEKTPLETIQNKDNKNIILFSSSWCGSCAKLTQDLKTMAREYPELGVYIMDLETDRDSANTLEVPVTPTLVTLEDGKSKNFTEVTIDTLPTIVSDFERIGIR